MANKYTKQVIDLGKAKELYESGMTQKEVAELLGTTQKVIYTRFKQDGFKCRIAKKRNQLGKNNDSWKGENADYKALHYRVSNLRGKPNKCEVCGTETAKRYEWANITGKYADPYDYKRMCKSCHSKFDGIHKNFGVGGEADGN